MMPLWTTASLGDACGWALVSVGLPCVAQRVWPMPIAPVSGWARELGLEILEFALGAPPLEPAVLERRDAGQVVAAVFESLERLDDGPRDRPPPQHAHNAAHRLLTPEVPESDVDSDRPAGAALTSHNG